MDDRTGQQIGNYRLTKLLGQGGFAEVYLAEHVYLKTLAAIKLVNRLSEKDDLETFLKEARIIANLAHPNIVRVLEFGEHEHIPYLVMDYAPAGTLRSQYPRGSQLALTQVVSYVKQLAAALQHAHDHKIVHCDVKPENMLVGRNGEVLLSDFGIAIASQTTRHPGSVNVGIGGTIAYMAPEQLQGRTVAASDQYALAVVAYEWITGTRPFTGSFTEVGSQHIFAPPPLVHEKMASISPEIDNVLQTALAKDPQQRYNSIQAFANALEYASLAERPGFYDQPDVADQSTMPMQQEAYEPSPDPVAIPSPFAPPPPAMHYAAQGGSFSPFPSSRQSATSVKLYQRRPFILMSILVLLLIAGGSGGFFLFQGSSNAANIQHTTAQPTSPSVVISVPTSTPTSPPGPTHSGVQVPTTNKSTPAIVPTLAPTPTADVYAQRKPLYRMVNLKLNDHFYTMSASERDTATTTDGYRYEGIAGYLFITQVSNTQPLYRLYSASTGDHFYTMSATERDSAIAKSGYVYESVTGYLFPSQVANTQPLYRLNSASTGDHFYTMSASERDTAMATGGYKYEGITGYLYVS